MSVDDRGIDQGAQLVTEREAPEGMSWMRNTTASSSAGSTQKLVEAEAARDELGEVTATRE